MLWMSAGIKISAQSMYPALSSSTYYNMDTTTIILGEEQAPRMSYTSEELARIFDGSWDPDSSMLAVPYEEVPCTKVGEITLPLRQINDDKFQNIIHEIINKTKEEGYSLSPDSIISRGVFFHISFYKDWRSPKRPIAMDVDIFSNYYLGTAYKYMTKGLIDSNVFCCYHQGILGIVTIMNDTVNESVKQFFSKTEQTVTLHLYKKQRMKYLLHSNLSSDRDARSTTYGLYRRYVFDNSIWIEHYYETNPVSR
jgi:hypothetical protein